MTAYARTHNTGVSYLLTKKTNQKIRLVHECTEETETIKPRVCTRGIQLYAFWTYSVLCCIYLLKSLLTQVCRTDFSWETDSEDDQKS